MRGVMRARLAIPILNEKDYTFVSPDVEWSSRADAMRLIRTASLKR